MHEELISQTRQCPGCKVILPYDDYPASDRYGILSPECRKSFDEILVKESEYFGYPPVHRLIVDAYALQHPPCLQRQSALNISKRFIDASIQSIGIHLLALYCAFEQKKELRSIASVMGHILANMAARNEVFENLQSPLNVGEIKVIDVRKAMEALVTLEEYNKVAWDWAHSVWLAWAEHHDKVRQWYQQYGV